MALYLGNQKIGGLNVFNDYPNIDITTETPTTINGLLKGNGSTVQVAKRGVDYVHPSDLATVATSGLMPAADKKRMDSTVAHYYGECSTASTDATKVVTIDNFVLSVGVQVTIKFTNAVGTDPDGDALTLNVSGTGALPMRRYGTTVMSTATTTSGWQAGAIQTFTYDGAAWVREFWYNTTYSNAALGQGYGTCSTAAATVAKVASLSSYKRVTGGIVSVMFSYDVPANATLNINSTGAKAIYYRNAKITADVIKAGDIATFVYSSYYRLISIDRGMTTTLSDLGVTATATELNYVDGVTSNIQTQLNNKINTSLKGVVNGVASLDANGKIPEGQLPIDNIVSAVITALPTWTGGSY